MSAAVVDWQARMRRLGRAAGAVAAALLAGCGTAPETVHRLALATWYEDGASYYQVSADGRSALFVGRRAVRPVALQGAPEPDSATYPSLGAARSAASSAAVRLAAWGGNPPSGLQVPEGALAQLSPDGSRLAYFLPGTARVIAGALDGLKPYDLDGTVTGMGWVLKGDLLYLLVLHPDGLSSLDRLNLETGALQPVRERLDAPPFPVPNSVAIAPDSRTIYLALASDSAPDPRERHRPEANRDADLFALDLARGSLKRVAAGPGDDFHPAVVAGWLYWTENDFQDEIVVLPAAGGPVRPVLAGGMLPAFSPDGRQLAYTAGGYRLADWGLDLDAAVVSVDDSIQPVGRATWLVQGYHEDFTPAFSPTGSWIAYHSHRTAAPVPSYFSPGHADDIYLKRPGAPMDQELRLTDWGWEVGPADWAPDGRRLVFDSWDRDGPPGRARLWVVTLDSATGRLVARRRLPLPAGTAGTRLAAWSPAREEVAFVTDLEPGRQALWISAPDGSRARRLVEFAGVTYGGLDWMPDGESLVYGALAGERLQLFRIARSGGSPVQLTRDASNVLLPQVSPDGRWIAATRMTHVKLLRRRRL